METSTGKPGYRDRRGLIVVMGALLLLAGVAAGFLGPLEMYCFYLFSRGGRFHYEGFGFGSFMFGNIAAQIAGYYLIAAVCIPLGYGHLRVRRWARKLALTLLWSWLVVGAPLVVLTFFILVGTKELPLPAVLAALVLLVLSYLLFPWLLIRFYQGENARRTFEAHDARASRLDGLPTPILVLSALYLFYAVVLHILILFNGLFPALGAFLYGLQGIALLDISIGCLLLLAWGTMRRRLWAWWGTVILLGLFTASTILTLVRTDYATLLAGLAFPARELQLLGGLPVQGYHLAVMVGMPLLITWGVALRSKRYFEPGV